MSGNANASPADTRQRGFTQLPNHILRARDISRDGKLLYGILQSYCWQKNTCFPSYKTLMADMQCCIQTLVNSIKELVACGLITVLRRGQGKTNLYILNDGTGQSEERSSIAPEVTEVCTLPHREQELYSVETEEYSDKEYEDRYLSSNRKGTNSGEYYVNSQGVANKPQESTQTPHQTRVEQDNLQSRTTGRSIEKLEPPKETKPVREKIHDMDEDIHRGKLLEYITDFAQEFHDQAPLTSSLTRAYHLFQQSGMTIDAFTAYMYTARAVTKERTGSIRKMTDHGLKAKMPYFFAVLEDRLGLRGKQGRRGIAATG